MKSDAKNVNEKNPRELKQETDQPLKKPHDPHTGGGVNGKGNVNTDTKTFNKPRNK